MMVTRPRPWDSPAVMKRSMARCYVGMGKPEPRQDDGDPRPEDHCRPVGTSARIASRTVTSASRSCSVSTWRSTRRRAPGGRGHLR